MEEKPANLQETQQALRALLSLFTQYASLLDLQLASVRKDMTATAEGLMAQVSAISEARGTQAKMADTIFVKAQGERDSSNSAALKNAFVAASAKEVEQHELAGLGGEQQDPGGATPEASARLRSYMSTLDQLDTRLERMLFTIIGALSTEDVVGQRIAHISQALALLKDGITEVLALPEGEYSVERVEAVVNRIKAMAYNSYTTESEKQSFIEVYGAAPPRRRAS